MCLLAYALHKLQMTAITPKVEQRSAMEAIYNCQDVFVWLPTGYGKSLRYQVLPSIMDYKHGVVEMQRHSLVLVVSPLVAQLITLICRCHKIYRPTCMCPFCHYVIISTLIRCMHKQR